MVFYAYVKNSDDDWSWRYLITAYSMDVVDEWYRVISEKAPSLERHTPEFYIFSRSKVDISQTIVTQTMAPKFMNKMFFTLLNDRDGRILSIIPPQHFSNHISGNSYYIRSKSDPRFYWYEGNDGYIYQSTERRSRFLVSIKDGEHNSGKVMIGSDRITISPVRNSNAHVSTGAGGKLVTNAGGETFTFSDLNGNFLGGEENAQSWKDTHVTKNTDGEHWELVE